MMMSATTHNNKATSTTNTTSSIDPSSQSLGSKPECRWLARTWLYPSLKALASDFGEKVNYIIKSQYRNAQMHTTSRKFGDINISVPSTPNYGGPVPLSPGIKATDNNNNNNYLQLFLPRQSGSISTRNNQTS